MKRSFFLIILALALCLAASAFAIELTFAQTCTEKTSSATQLYVEMEDGTLQGQQTLPAGTYIKTNGLSKDGKTGITYGFEQYGYIDGSVITSAVETVTLPSGKTVRVGEALVRSRSALNLWLDMEYGETLDGSTYTDASGASHEIGNESADGEDDLEDRLAREAKYQTATGRAGKSNGWSAATIYKDDRGNEAAVQVLYMGLARSKVLLDGKEQMVETWRLSWNTEAPEDKVLAVITPKDASNVRMRATNNAKSTVLDRVDTSRVVQVLKTDKNWTLVDTNDDLLPCGYIQTAVLTFYPNERKEYETAVLAINGSTKNGEGNVVKARQKASRNGRIIGKFNLGETLTVIPGEDSEWIEVDVGGYHAFIQSEYITYRSDATVSPKTP